MMFCIFYNPLRLAIMDLIVQMRKLRHREAGWLAQGHTARRWQSQDSPTLPFCFNAHINTTGWMFFPQASFMKQRTWPPTLVGQLQFRIWAGQEADTLDTHCLTSEWGCSASPEASTSILLFDTVLGGEGGQASSYPGRGSPSHTLVSWPHTSARVILNKNLITSTPCLNPYVVPLYFHDKCPNPQNMAWPSVDSSLATFLSRNTSMSTRTHIHAHTRAHTITCKHPRVSLYVHTCMHTHTHTCTCTELLLHFSFSA